MKAGWRSGSLRKLACRTLSEERWLAASAFVRVIASRRLRIFATGSTGRAPRGPVAAPEVQPLARAPSRSAVASERLQKIFGGGNRGIPQSSKDRSHWSTGSSTCCIRARAVCKAVATKKSRPAPQRAQRGLFSAMARANRAVAIWRSARTLRSGSSAWWCACAVWNFFSSLRSATRAAVRLAPAAEILSVSPSRRISSDRRSGALAPLNNRVQIGCDGWCEIRCASLSAFASSRGTSADASSAFRRAARSDAGSASWEARRATVSRSMQSLRPETTRSNGGRAACRAAPRRSSRAPVCRTPAAASFNRARRF